MASFFFLKQLSPSGSVDIYTATLCVLLYVHGYSPPLRGIVVYYLRKAK